VFPLSSPRPDHSGRLAYPVVDSTLVAPVSADIARACGSRSETSILNRPT
jgi:hypothetical protein